MEYVDGISPKQMEIMRREIWGIYADPEPYRTNKLENHLSMLLSTHASVREFSKPITSNAYAMTIEIIYRDQM